MDETNDQTVCGIICSECQYFGENCNGCNHVRGIPFWVSYIDADICPVYDCCVNERGYKHCGRCSELICEKFTRFQEPGVSEEEKNEALEKIKKNLLARDKQ